MAEPQFKPARPPIEQFLSDVRGQGILQTLNPNLKNDPVFQRVSSALDFIIPKPDDPLSVLGGAKAASFFSDVPSVLVKKLMNAYKKRDDAFLGMKREADNIRVDGRAAVKGERKQQLEFNKANKEIKEVADQIFKETGKKVPTEFTASNVANPRLLGLESLIKDPTNIFHGSQTKGLGSLKLPEGYGSEGGIYLVDKFIDPRLRQYVKGRPSKGAPGSAYVTEPNFKNVLTVGDTSKEMDRLLKNLEINLSNQIKNPFKFSEPAYQVRQLRKNVVGVPTNFTKEASEGLRDMGVDAIRIPNKRRGVDNSDTFISLNPSENLNILDEINLAELDELVRRLSGNK